MFWLVPSTRKRVKKYLWFRIWYQLILLFMYGSTSLFSLHIRSMWETICDAWACWSGWNFGPNSTVYPYSVEYPPPENWNLGRSWHLKTFQFSVTEYPPPPNWNLGRTWHLKTFQFSVTEYPPSPKNWNLGRSWHLKTFQFSVTEYPTPPPPPPQIEI